MKEKIADLMHKKTGLPKEQILSLIEIPKDSSLGDYAFPCFSLSILLKKNPVEIAKEIENSLLEHNKRAGERVSFGIGVHNGEMILENINNQLKISPVGSSIPYSKKIADTMSSGLGVSESVHRKLLGKVKSDKIEGTTFWRISKIRDRELHSEFINRFMQRQRSDGLKRK